VAQIQDYAGGIARDPLLELVSKPAADLSYNERLLALEYLFLANSNYLIGRYPRYQELYDRFRGSGSNAAQSVLFFNNQDFADLQVLSQLAWFDEFFLHDPDVASLIAKGRHYDAADQRLMLAKQSEILSAVLPAYAEAARRGAIEISTSPYYHPILPLLCDSDLGGVSSPGLSLPQSRFRHPEDAREQMLRGLDSSEKVFGKRPLGMWPSEGSISDEVFALAHALGVNWMASDEGVLGRSIDFRFARDVHGRLTDGGAERLYAPWLYEKGDTRMHVLFRDRALSDLIGFVYSRMPAEEAAQHLIRNIKQSAEPLLRQGKDAVVPIILDGENAWEYYPGSGREFLRRVYDALQNDPVLEGDTVSEAIDKHPDPPRLGALTPGSWINANFNVWIGAPEDNRSWDYLASARAFYGSAAPLAEEADRRLAYEDLLIAQGSDWNWWYGPEHHTPNDRDFDELYRKHLSNIYHALGASPPLYLAQPIAGGMSKPVFAPQTAYIHPQVRADFARYFDWVGAAIYTAERRGGAMHGKQFYFDAIYAGIDENSLYGRVDFSGGLPDEALELVINCKSVPSPEYETSGSAALRNGAAYSLLRLEARMENKHLVSWSLRPSGADKVLAASGETPENGLRVSVFKNFEFQLPLKLLGATFGWTIQLRFSLWRDRLPVDGLPLEGWIELPVVPEEELRSSVYNYSASS
jgi:alpha-amylase/alpha-mannosidase (GH57 family)